MRLLLTPAAQRERRWGTVRGVTLTVATLAVAVLVVILALVVALGPGPAVVRVPQVTGQSLAAAEEILSRAGLEGHQSAEVFDENTGPGVVVRQRPEADMAVKEGRVVDLAVSRGPKIMAVPTVVGQPLAAAQEQLTSAYLRVGRVRTVPSERPAELVLQQDPAAEAKVERDREVALVVSGGSSYGAWETGAQTYVFRHLSLVVPQGPSLQRVEVKLETGGEEESVYDVLQRPGDVVNLDLYGRQGAQVKVYLEEKQVSSETLKKP